jgi:hypothetical protein
MNKYISKFEDLCDKLEESEFSLLPTTDKQKQTFFPTILNNYNYTATKDQCKLESYAQDNSEDEKESN